MGNKLPKGTRIRRSEQAVVPRRLATDSFRTEAFPPLWKEIPVPQKARVGSSYRPGSDLARSGAEAQQHKRARRPGSGRPVSRLPSGPADRKSAACIFLFWPAARSYRQPCLPFAILAVGPTLPSERLIPPHGRSTLEPVRECRAAVVSHRELRAVVTWKYAVRRVTLRRPLPEWSTQVRPAFAGPDVAFQDE
ncbi:MAG: hypothetical protein ACI80V_002881 [Rhodothermales bacterium]|jgi:hypothetical protein